MQTPQVVSEKEQSLQFVPWPVANIPQRPGLIDILAGNVISAFGPGVVLAPLDELQSRNSNKESLAANISPEQLQHRLWSKDIAVVCGPLSGNLCAIYAKRLIDIKDFTVANPKFRNAMTVRTPEGFFLFFKFLERCPPQSMDLGQVKLLTNCHVEIVARFMPLDAYTVHIGEVPRVSLLDVQSCSHACAALRVVYTDARFGPAIRQKKLYEKYFAEHVVRELGLMYDARHRQFFAVRAGEMAEISDELIKGQALALGTYLAQIGMYPKLAVLMNINALKKILETCRILAQPGQLPPAPTHLQLFVRDCLSTCPGADVTSQELFDAYVEYCARQNIHPIADCVFFKRLPPEIESRFSIKKVHDVVRDDKEARGYRNVSLKTATS